MSAPSPVVVTVGRHVPGRNVQRSRVNARDARNATTSGASIGLSVASWRHVPTTTSACGEESLKSIPRIEQIYVNAPEEMGSEVLERPLYMARRRNEKARSSDSIAFYIPSLSGRVIAYKGDELLPVRHP